jgi:DNA polymerase-3 subunit epsilon
MNTQQLAKQILNNDPIILDTETTGLDDDDQIIELGVIDVHGVTILNTLVKSTKPSHPKALEVHQITETHLAEHGKDWSEVSHDLGVFLDCHPVIMYNSPFDTRMIEQTCLAHQVEKPSEYKVYDLMELANRHFISHAQWCQKRSQFKRLSLAKCCEIAGIKYKGDAHRAIVDCHATLELLKFIAHGQVATASNDNKHTLVIEA